MTDFATRAVQATTAAVNKRARLLCDAEDELAAKPKTQWALASAASLLRLVVEERPSREELVAAVKQFDKWLEAAAKPATAPRLRVVPERKAS